MHLIAHTFLESAGQKIEDIFSASLKAVARYHVRVLWKSFNIGQFARRINNHGFHFLESTKNHNRAAISELSKNQ
jgi:hypothetical protein